MANQEQLDILKQGVKVWNEWRLKNLGVDIDLSDDDLSASDLNNAHLFSANLSGANLSSAILSGADFTAADLSSANLSGVDLSGARLFGADLSYSILFGADLSDTHIYHATLYNTDLNNANLSNATFYDTDLSGTDLSGTNVLATVFGDVDLSTVKGLETVEHIGPSTIGIDTIIRSQGNIPEVFLRGAGVPPSIIEAIPSLVGSLKPIDFYSCFISYSSKDQDFAERLYADLQAKGVRCWLDKEDLKIGEKFRPRINEAIRQHDKLLLVLSQHSVRSTWVETEVETAFEKERRYKKLVLFPIRLDEAVMRTRQAWAADIRKQRHIGDFTCCKDHDAYQKAFTRLLRDLKAEDQKT